MSKQIVLLTVDYSSKKEGKSNENDKIRMYSFDKIKMYK